LAGAAAADGLGAVLAGEYALQAGQLDAAVDWYLKAARAAPQDAAVAERAAMLALLADDDAAAAAALALWQVHAAHTLPVRAAQAQLALRRGKLRPARRELIALLGDADPAGRHLALEVLSRSQQNPARLARLIHQLLDANAMPREWAAWMRLRALADGLRDVTLSARIVSNIIQRFPDAPRLPLLRARALRAQGKPEAARAALAAADEQHLLASGLGLLLVEEYIRLGEFTRAGSVLAQAPQTVQVLGMRAWLFSQTGDGQALLALYTQLREHAGFPGSAQRLLLGQLAEHLERWDEALDWYAAVPAGEERVQARLRSVIVLHRLGQTEAAHMRVRELQDDAQLDQSVRIQACLLEAELRQREGDPAGEAAVFARALAAYPDAPDLLYARSLMWERRDDIARAEADLRLILLAQPDNVVALNALGYILADRTGRYREALALIERARVAEPDNAAIIDSYGWVLYRLGRSEDALIHLRRAYSLQKNAEIAAHVAQVLWTLERRDEARAYFDEARAIDADDRALLRALRETGA